MAAVNVADNGPTASVTSTAKKQAAVEEEVEEDDDRCVVGPSQREYVVGVDGCSTASYQVRRGSRGSVLTVYLCPGVREHLNIVFIGHVDAGKSTLGGQILYRTVGGGSAYMLVTNGVNWECRLRTCFRTPVLEKGSTVGPKVWTQMHSIFQSVLSVVDDATVNCQARSPRIWLLLEKLEEWSGVGYSNPSESNSLVCHLILQRSIGVIVAFQLKPNAQDLLQECAQLCRVRGVVKEKAIGDCGLKGCFQCLAGV